NSFYLVITFTISAEYFLIKNISMEGEANRLGEIDTHLYHKNNCYYSKNRRLTYVESKQQP
ncbi:MAG: hypothetical protein ABF643_08280, partial [Oenococcus oeni]